MSAIQIDDETNELSGKIQFVCKLMLAMKGEQLSIGSTWEDEAKKLATNVLELIDRIGLPLWEMKDDEVDQSATGDTREGEG